MPKQPKEKSAHLQELEAVFDRHTRRFSPFNVLGLRSSEQDTSGSHIEGIKTNETFTHIDVGTTHPPESPTHTHESATSPPGEGIHTKVVEVIEDLQVTTTFAKETSTHIGVGTTHPPDSPTHTYGSSILLSAIPQEQQSLYTDMRMHDVLAATQLRGQLGKKARQVLRYLNSIRSLERPAYTVPVGYAQISATADVHPHYLRRNVLPKLTMIGLIGIVHKSFQGTIYHLHYDAGFLEIVTSEAEEPLPYTLPDASLPTSPLSPLSPHSAPSLPSWLEREHWGWLTPEMFHQLMTKAGSEAQAQEKLAIILYNETHGPSERHVRDRRAVLAYYLRTPQADIWPNDDGFETLVLRHARQERDRALQGKALAEETLRVRQEAAKIRFLASLTDPQMQWLRQEAKQRVDAQPSARFLTSRYPLYKAEEDQLVEEWMDRIQYGERVPDILPEKEGWSENTRRMS